MLFKLPPYPCQRNGTLPRVLQRRHLAICKHMLIQEVQGIMHLMAWSTMTCDLVACRT